MSKSTLWPEAALAGLASSMRTMAGPAALAARGHITGKPRVALLLAATGEVAADKTPVAVDRTEPPGLGGRVVAGGYTGQVLAGPAGAVAGALGAGLGTFATWRARGLVVETTGIADPVVAVGEDVIAYGLAAIATRSRSGPASAIEGAPGPDGAAADPYAPPSAAAAALTPGSGTGPTGRTDSASSPGGQPRSVLADAGRGVLAGLAGTAAMTIAHGAEFVLTDAEPSSAPADVLDTIKRGVGLGRLRRRHRRAANQGMHWLLGTSWGVPYGMIAGGLDLAPEISGPAFGLLVWSAALAHQPALGVADVPWKRSPRSLGSEALFHLVYGIGLGAAWRTMRG